MTGYNLKILTFYLQNKPIRGLSTPIKQLCSVESNETDYLVLFYEPKIVHFLIVGNFLQFLCPSYSMSYYKPSKAKTYSVIVIKIEKWNVTKFS